MKRVVVDTNVLVSFLTDRDSLKRLSEKAMTPSPRSTSGSSSNCAAKE